MPDHVRELAKHRHRGLDFIFVSQSPAKQVDEFVHDLIERHIHVRRRFGIISEEELHEASNHGIRPLT